MTFIDISGAPPTPGLIAGYSILLVVSLACAGWAIHLGRTRMHYHSFFSVRVLFPIALFIMALENLALVLSKRVYNELTSDNIDNNYDENLFFKAVFILQPFEVPILLVVVFELTYLVHKRRSVNFCGMDFDEGRRVDSTAFMSCMLRNSIRSLATVLLVIGLLVNLDLIQGNAYLNQWAGRTGWWFLFNDDDNGYAEMQLLLSLIPTAVLVVVSVYLSIMLWRYGTESSMVVHSSICNPWFYPFFGTVAMAAGQFFGPDLYPIMSNSGLLVFVITLLALMAEVDKDIVATHQVACFLVEVAQKGDQISVTAHPRTASSVSLQQLNTNSLQQQHSPVQATVLSMQPNDTCLDQSREQIESLDKTERTRNIGIAIMDEEMGNPFVSNKDIQGDTDITHTTDFTGVIERNSNVQLIPESHEEATTATSNAVNTSVELYTGETSESGAINAFVSTQEAVLPLKVIELSPREKEKIEPIAEKEDIRYSTTEEIDEETGSAFISKILKEENGEIKA